MARQHTEQAFEETIERHLLGHGWEKGNRTSYRVDLGFDAFELLAFVQNSQREKWEKLEQHHGSTELAQRALYKRVADELDSRGTLDVLRKGVEVNWIQFELAYWRPAHRITPELWELYETNRLTVTRQVHHSESNPHDSVDVLLLINGIPVATAELKNQVTGQGVRQAQHQYETDRNPADLLFRARSIVHFAVDQDVVSMTTRLARESTRWLPFNQGSGGPGQQGGAGNPVNSGGYKAAYLWNQVWQRDAWLELFGSFVSEDTGGKTVTKIKPHERRWLFPRFHQWHAVSTTAAHVRGYGPGHNYLLQHSTGSGKSNTIAWLASTLATLHTPSDASELGPGATTIGLGPDQPVFSKVIIVTDRVVLDRQLQDTVTGFDHTPGTIQKIDQNSAQLREALESAKARIIITTLQKFPVVAEKATTLAGARFAVIADEAHSSQAGEAAKDLKIVLAGLKGEKALEAAEAAEMAGQADDPQDRLAAAARARGKQTNLSFFAFTATPKQKTLEMFGERIPDPAAPDGIRLMPFHLYSMRQAIEEEFVRDVLKNYLTYSMYYRLANGLGGQDPEVPKGKAASALARFVSLHPSAFSQKAEIIVEHFRAHTAAKIGGQAKAMVVTRSRLHAVRMKRAIDDYITSNGYSGIAALVAFSGAVEDPEVTEKEFTEAKMNGFSEGLLPKRFRSDDYQVLVVAEKYQTGFDEPLLHTMYVDKKLEGVKAVQTLSRLNRIAPGKTDTFVLDFVNSAEDIQAAFAPFYERTWAQPTDPNILSNLKTRLWDAGVLDINEVDALVSALLSQTSETNESLYAHTDLALGRYLELSEDDREDFRTALRDFTRLYAFLAHVVPVGSPDMERIYLYGRVLLPRLPGDEDNEIVDLSGAATLTHLRIEKAEFTDASLATVSDEKSEQKGHTGQGQGKQYDDPAERLSSIIGILNERFGLNLTDADQLFFEQVEAEVAKNSRAQAVALNNDLDQFMTVFDDLLEGVIIDRHNANDALLTAFLDKPDFREALTRMMGREFYKTIRS
ncbi:DEAD/DEAH box helicase family protein [Rhodococcus opacus]|uniref:DEAD/DEAH box helicase family protein n=1 Tax=Rhodococcus opacus TaxID=37919 RepID=A0AAX3YQG5_RHOOP|nr:type I restriction endonuclease [Rhodococcus opacus]MCZ4587624.1 DEAD/DEAH box helicase family protein [Rhodococcus opacus]WLF51380.1 DEAD/DEAH box helicase family protein [Rhodococcus opacus]